MNLKRSLAATVLAASLVATSVAGPARAAEPVATAPTSHVQHALLVEPALAVPEARSTRGSAT